MNFAIEQYQIEKYTLSQYPDKQGDPYVTFGLTGFGSRFVQTGFLRGYGYVRGGINGYLTPAVKLTAKWESFRAALASQDLKTILLTAKALPSVSVSDYWHDRISVSYHGATLFTARKRYKTETEPFGSAQSS